MSEDLIRRSDAIKAIEPYLDYIEIIPLCGAKPYVREAVCGIRSKIKFIPTIEPKRGEWIGEADGYYNGELIYDTWYCSNCDYVVDDEEPPTWSFCPNCGADMRGKDDEYERAVEQMEYDMLYEPTYNPEDGSM